MNNQIFQPLRSNNAVTRLGIAVRNMLKSVLPLLLLVIMNSCKTQDRITYFQDADQMADTLTTLQLPITIEKYDELKIVVSAENAAAVATFNKPMFSNRQFGDQYLNVQNQLQTYLVDEQGCISFPTLGRVHVEGMTTAELTQSLEQQISQYVKNPIVTIDPLTIEVQVLGEVAAPGPVLLKAHQATIMNAISGARDLTIYGDRKSVLVIHREGGRQVKHRVDLTSANVLTDPLCIMHQNDIVIVSPNDARRSSSRYDSMKQQNLSFISTIVSVVSVLASLTIAIWK